MIKRIKLDAPYNIIYFSFKNMKTDTLACVVSVISHNQVAFDFDEYVQMEDRDLHYYLDDVVHFPFPLFKLACLDSVFKCVDLVPSDENRIEMSLSAKDVKAVQCAEHLLNMQLRHKNSHFAFFEKSFADHHELLTFCQELGRVAKSENDDSMWARHSLFDKALLVIHIDTTPCEKMRKKLLMKARIADKTRYRPHSE